MERVNGQGFADDEPPVPTSVDPDRECDFCGVAPTTHWLRFNPATSGAGWILPGYLGACSACASKIDFSDAEQLVAMGDQPAEIADLLAKHFRSITAGA
jgi:hypothetical protein